MGDPNFDFFKSKFHVSKDTYKILQSLALKRKLKSGEVLIKQGEKSKKIAFLVSGLMRAYSTLESGKQITKNIFRPISFVGGFSSIIKDKPSHLCYEALVDALVFEVNFDEFSKICNTNIEVSNLYNRILEYVFIMYEKKQLATMALNGTERYLLLKK
ncbi:Crp/Fnr family transcriptional regulator [Winogradskyella sp. PG-2]|uniref:Crp/Fnr family transcriptional regulator n=1 Tax=Winogradskyella sp. PG-2 TaxID=754409 RepID=UPI000458654E|nr:Crp/Fnr family transcriptional regulator [Winogradskyella sp. PG-2]BAO75817.1 cAMP-binding proteins - catabolite gene activator and regulatory subunit of cAMP-dependent protein kinases [Winogradskyella sp. PG-2]